jgi:hypothetical protein
LQTDGTKQIYGPLHAITFPLRTRQAAEMGHTPYAPPKSAVVGPAALEALPLPLRAALWIAPVLVCGAYVGQTISRFPPLSPGASITAGMFVLGVCVGALSAMIAGYQLIRTPRARTTGAIALTGVNSLLLLIALLLIPALVASRS